MREQPAISLEVLRSIRGRELHVLKNPGEYSSEQVAAADALARCSWPEVARIWEAAIAGAGQQRTDAN